MSATTSTVQLRLFSLTLLLCVTIAHPTCHPSDLAALLGFLDGLDPSTRPWPRNASANCCRWDGVVCELNTTVSRVVELNLGDRELRGGISDSISGLEQLRLLNLSLNSLSGTLPAGLYGLRRLEVIDLRDNRFRGGIGDGIGNFSNLSHLDLSNNRFSGVIPDVFEKLPKLENFSATGCWISGAIPQSLSSLSNLRLLQLTNNTLNGTIDVDFGNLPRLSSLHLSSNRFHGEIPASLSSCKELKIVNLAKNRLTGEIPKNFKELQALSYLSLSNNSFSNISGALVTLSNCANLSFLVLSLSFHDEAMPTVGILGFKKMKVLIIPYCGLKGRFPSWVKSLSELAVLDLSWNYLWGSIPPWLGGFKHLFYLDLSNNSFTGKIPKSLAQLESLAIGSRLADDGSLGAEFPYYLSRKDGLWGQLQYKQFSSLPPTLNLSYNRLSGQLWGEFGRLKKLHVLILANNYISGSIPIEFSGMQSLEVLDLSSNNLSGEIPIALAHLTFLSKFSVANNHLQGMIPSSGQFHTFPSSSFEGNPDLCGEFFYPCPGPGHNSSASPALMVEEDGIEILGLPFYIGITVGFMYALIFCRKLFKYLAPRYTLHTYRDVNKPSPLVNIL